MNLEKIMCEGAMKALVLVGKHQGYSARQLEECLPKLREIILAEYPGFTQGTLKEALEARMGDDTYRQILNVECHVWAVRAIRETLGAASPLAQAV